MTILGESHCCIIVSDELLLLCEAFSDGAVFGVPGEFLALARTLRIVDVAASRIDPVQHTLSR